MSKRSQFERLRSGRRPALTLAHRVHLPSSRCPMRVRAGILALSLLLLASTSRAGELRPETLKAWDEYIQSVNAQFQDRLNRDRHFLRIEEVPDRLSSLIQGQILVEPVAG